MIDKTCGSCTKCCEGTLKLIVNGQKVSNGVPCHLLSINSGCSDYENRPAMPCKVYKCVWLKDKDIPEKFKPNNINLIIHRMWLKSHEYYTLIPAGSELKTFDIEEVFEWFKDKGLNFYFSYSGKDYIFGSNDFIKECYNDSRLLVGKNNG